MDEPDKYVLNGIHPEHVASVLFRLEDVAKREDVPLGKVIDTWRTLELSRAAAIHDKQMAELCEALKRVERAVLGLQS